MTTTYDPQAAVSEARANYREVTARLGLLGLDTAIPDSVRSMAESAVDRTRETYNRSADAFEASVASFENSFDAAGQGAAAFNRKIIGMARRNVDTAFDLAQSLAGAKSISDIVGLHAAYWQKQISSLTAQAEEVRKLSTKVTADQGARGARRG
jgi:hypothetical protein